MPLEGLLKGILGPATASFPRFCWITGSLGRPAQTAQKHVLASPVRNGVGVRRKAPTRCYVAIKQSGAEM